MTILFLSTLSALCMSCSKDDDVTPEVQVPAGNENYFEKSMDFDSPAAEKSFTFSSNVPWSISVSETRNGSSWLTVSPTNGEAGTQTIKVKAAENTTYDDRNTVITLTAGEISRKIIVNQKQLDALTLTSNRFEIPVTGGTVNIEVKANVNYETIIPDDYQSWIHKNTSATRGLSASTLSFTIDKSEEYGKREGKIIVKSSNKEEVVSIYQTGDGILTLSQNEYNLNNSSQEIAIEINSNFEYAVELPDADWISEITSETRGVSTHTLRLAIKENESYDGRSAKIRIYDKNSSISEEVVINQSQKNALIIDKNEFVFDENGGSFSVVINSNIDYKVSINVDWITESTATTRSLATIGHTFDVSAISDNSDREGTITFSDTKTGISENVIVKQNRAIFFESTSLTLMEGTEQTIRVTNRTDQNINWSSSETSVATVDNTGLVITLSRGNTTITATTVDGKHTCKCTIIVKNIEDCVSMQRIGTSSSITPWGSRYGVTFKITNSSTETIHLVSLAGVTDGVAQDLEGGKSIELTISSSSSNIQNYQQTLIYTYKGNQYSIKG